MKKAILTIILVLLVALGIYLIVTSSNTSSNVVANSQENVKTFILSGKNFKYIMDNVVNPEIRVKEGDKIKIIFNNEEGFHDWVVDEFGATEQIKAGNSTSLEFIADKKGTFEYYCSVGKHRDMGMKGVFIVE